MKECEDTPSISSSVSSFNPLPNFAEECKKVRQEALEAEKQATLFIQQSENNIPPPIKVVPPEASRPENVCPTTPKAAHQKKHGGFFSKLFKSHSKDNLSK